MVIEIFAGTAPVASSLKQLGVNRALGVDHARSKQCMAAWRSCYFVDASRRRSAFAMACRETRCGNLSRTTMVVHLERPLKCRGKSNSHGLRPLRDDQHPNARIDLSLQERQRVSLAHRLCHFTARSMGKWRGLHCVSKYRLLDFSRCSNARQYLSYMPPLERRKQC